MANSARGFIQAYVANPNPYTQAVAQKQAALGRAAATRLQKQKGAQQLALQAQRQQGRQQLLGGQQAGRLALSQQNVAQRKQLASQYQQQRLQMTAAQNANRQAAAQAEASENVASGAVNTFSGVADRVNAWAASIPTPGGIFVLLVAIFITLWVLIPVNDQGYTRAELLWLTVLGRTVIHGSSQESQQKATSVFSGTTPVGLTSLGTVVPLQDFSAASEGVQTV